MTYDEELADRIRQLTSGVPGLTAFAGDQGDSERPLVGGSVKIIRVGDTQTLARVWLTVDQLNTNPRVRLSPPSDLVK
jgi:hypothetical protein